MDDLENLFVPYKDMILESSTPVKSAPKTNMYMIYGVCLFCCICFFLYTYFSKPKSYEPIKNDIPLNAKTPSGVPFKNIPQQIPILRGGGTKEELARSIGSSVKDVLTKYEPNVTASDVFDIVHFTVKTVMKNEKIEIHKNDIQTPNANRKTKIISTVGLELPIKEESEESEPAGEKRNKINAESDPKIIEMMKLRKTVS